MDMHQKFMAEEYYVNGMFCLYKASQKIYTFRYNDKFLKCECHKIGK